MNTKTTEWEERFMDAMMEFGMTHPARDMVAESVRAHQLGSVEKSREENRKHIREVLFPIVSSLLHQSRTELMRKVVGVVGKKLCPLLVL